MAAAAWLGGLGTLSWLLARARDLSAYLYVLHAPRDRELERKGANTNRTVAT